jgi:hypothetical protein
LAELDEDNIGQTAVAFVVFLLVLGLLFEFRHEIRALLRSSVRRNERILGNIKSRVEILELAKKGGIDVPQDAMKGLSDDIKEMLRLRESPARARADRTPNPRKRRYPLGALGGFSISIILVCLINIETGIESGVALFMVLIFTVLGILSAAFFTSRRSGNVFSVFAGALGSLAFVAVSLALIALQNS